MRVFMDKGVTARPLTVRATMTFGNRGAIITVAPSRRYATRSDYITTSRSGRRWGSRAKAKRDIGRGSLALISLLATERPSCSRCMGE